MTPQRKRTLWRIAAIVAPLLLAVAGAAARGMAHQVVTQGQLRQHADSDAQRFTAVGHRIELDSLRHDAFEARTDTALAQLVRACIRRGECS